MEDKKKKRLEEATQSGSTHIIVDPPSLIRQHVKWMARTKKSGQMTTEATKKIAYKIVSDSHFSVIIFNNNCWMSKPNLFHLLTTGFPERVGLKGKLCRSRTSGCTNCCHWVTRTHWSCSYYWSWCHDQTILWTGIKELSHIYFHGSRRPGAVDTKNQGPAREVGHRKSDSTTNVILQPNLVPIIVTDAITGTHTASWVWGWSFY